MAKPLLMQLREEARKKRDLAIREINRQYAETIRQIGALQHRLLLKGDKAFKLAIYSRFGLKEAGGEYAGMTCADAITLILKEGTPMTIKQLAVECQARGCRPLDAPRSVINSIRRAINYHTDRFRQNEQGKWELVE